MHQVSRKWIGLGVLLGVLTGSVVIVLSYVAGRVAGLIFPPFSLFDFVTRVLPGAAVTFTIDLMAMAIGRFWKKARPIPTALRVSIPFRSVYDRHGDPAPIFDRRYS